MSASQRTLWSMGCACLFAACTGSTQQSTISTCVPGASAVCGCTDGRVGAQVCDSSGTFEECVCTGGVSFEFDAGTFVVSTLAGNGTDGYQDGTGGALGTAEFDSPNGIAVAAGGNIEVADFGNNRIRQIDSLGNVTTLAGDNPGYADGTGGASGTAQFNTPFAVAAATDGSGSLYVADSGNNRIRKIDSSGNVTTVAGNGTAGDVDGTGGASGTAEFDAPCGVAADPAGNLYVADSQNNRIRKIDSAGNVTTFSGNGVLGDQDGTGGRTGSAEYARPYGVAVDAAGKVFVADTLNHKVRALDAEGNATTLAGNGQIGYEDGTGGPVGNAEFGVLYGLAVDAADNVYVADHDNDRVRVINAAGQVTTIAGDGKPGFADGTGGPLGTAEFNLLTSAAVDSTGRIYITDNANSRIRVLTPTH